VRIGLVGGCVCGRVWLVTYSEHGKVRSLDAILVWMLVQWLGLDEFVGGYDFVSLVVE
jgi:hypothetical protein